MSFENFVPQVWAADLLVHLDNSLVYANLMNRDYEGDIKGYGDTVVINQIGDVSIKTYTGADIDDPDEIDGNTRLLNIDTADYYNIQVKDIDRAQSKYELMSKAMVRSAYRMAEKIDTRVAAKYVDAAINGIDVQKPDPEHPGKTMTVKEKTPTLGTTAAPKSVSVDNAWDLLVDLGVLLSENNVPKAGRWVVLPPWYIGMLVKDIRFSGGGTDGSRQTLSNGLVSENVAGFRVYETNAVPNADNKWNIIAGTEMAGSFAMQLTETEAYRREKNFSDGVKGLQVYGSAITQPKAAAVLTVSYAKPAQSA